MQEKFDDGFKKPLIPAASSSSASGVSSSSSSYASSESLISDEPTQIPETQMEG